MISWLKSFFSKVFKPSKGPEIFEEPVRDNLPEVVTHPLPDNDTSEHVDEVLLWYPKRVISSEIDELRMKTRGYYSGGHPEGAIVHFTAGRSRRRSEGGPRNPTSHKEMGISGVMSAIKEGSYAYFIVDRDGNVYQQFPLNRWGYHAGQSLCPMTNRSSVSMYYVGIEVQNAGLLTKVDEDRYKAWFSNTEKGDKYFHKSKGEVEYFKKRGNIQAGHYHQFSHEQKKALVELLLWLEDNGNGIFSIEKVFGHDEVAPKRKNDPGGSLGMSMPEFRRMLKDVREEEKRRI